MRSSANWSVPCRRPWRFGSVFGSGPQVLRVRVRVAILSFRVGVLEVDGELVRYRVFGDLGAAPGTGSAFGFGGLGVRGEVLGVLEGVLGVWDSDELGVLVGVLG